MHAQEGQESEFGEQTKEQRNREQTPEDRDGKIESCHMYE